MRHLDECTNENQSLTWKTDLKSFHNSNESSDPVYETFLFSARTFNLDFLSASFYTFRHQHICRSRGLSKSAIIKPITALMKTSFPKRVSSAPSHPVTGVCVGKFKKRECPLHPAGKISVTSLICINFLLAGNSQPSQLSHVQQNFITCGALVAQNVVRTLLLSQWAGVSRGLIISILAARGVKMAFS